MGSGQQHERGSGAGKGLLVVVVGILVTAAAGATATYWLQAADDQAAAQTGAGAAPAPARDGAEAAPGAPVRPEPPGLIRAAAMAPVAGETHHADIYFDVRSTRLRADAVRVLQDRAALIAAGGDWGVLVQGQADRQGPAEYNRALAQRRAEAVSTFLVELGVPEAAIRVVTIGQEGALCPDASRQCQHLDRRVHVEIRKLALTAASPLPGGTAVPARPAIAVGDTLDTGASSGAAPAGDGQ
jgi:peptidoglycan-associated lipoprotein